METLLAELWPFLAAFYLVEGVAVVRPFQRILLSRAGGGFEVRRPGLTYLGILPWRQIVSAQSLPLAVSPEGVHALRSSFQEEPRVLEPEALVFTRFEELKGAEAEHRSVRCGSRVLVRAAVVEDAKDWASLLTRMAEAAPEQRLQHLRTALESSTALAELRTLRARLRLPWLVLATLTGLLFVTLFGVLPARLWWPLASVIPLESLLATLVLLHVTVVGMSAALLLRGGVPVGRSLSTLFSLLLIPTTSCRAALHVAAPLYRRFEPATLLVGLLERDALLAQARRELAHIRFSQERTTSLGLEPYWTLRRGAWERLLAAAGVSLQDVLVEPAPATGGSRFCPMCGTGYDRGERCSDCDVPLTVRSAA
jgi:hypothetical protein